MSSGEATAILRDYIARTEYYDLDSGCLRLTEEEYRNAGYTIIVADRCESRVLGRWRIDAKTSAVYRQREDGRYLRP